MSNLPPKYEELVFNTSEAVVDTSNQPLKYAISGRPIFGSVTVFLDDPQSEVRADGGAMIYMDDSLQVETSCGDTGSALLRCLCTTESACFNTFKGPGFVTFGFDEPGDVRRLFNRKTHVARL